MNTPSPETTGTAGIGGSSGAISTVSEIASTVLIRRGTCLVPNSGSASRKPVMRNSGHR